MPVRREPLLKRRADVVGVLEAAYAPAADDAAWADGVRARFEALFANALGTGMVLFEHDPGFVENRTVLASGFGLVPTPEALRVMGEDGLRVLFYPPSITVTHSEIHTRLRPEAREHMVGVRASLGIAEAVGTVVHPEPGLALVFFAALAERRPLTPHERTTLSRVALHIESGLRLRRRPEVAVALLGANGKLLDADRSAPHGSALESAAKAIERTRRGRARDVADPLATWSALVAGRVSLVERSHGSKRYYVVLENPLVSRAARSLTSRESNVVAMAARGMPSKLVAYALGLSPSSVSRSLTAAASKLGLSDSREVLRVASRLVQGAPVEIDVEALTAAESEILDFVRAGLSNAAIASERGRSARTVENQVAAVLRKTGAASRQSLLVARALND
jgi:DNA-binding NarL/FixJ family response regulator